METKKTPDSALIDHLGGPAAVAGMFDDPITSQAVSQWRVHGIPTARRMVLRMLRPDVFESTESVKAA